MPRLGRSWDSVLGQGGTSFLWPTTSLEERELPFGKLLHASMFDVSDVYRSEAA